MMNRLEWHKSLTMERILEACRRRMFTLDNPGFCLKCGYEADSCEPDARNYKCENCEEPQVFGADELLMIIL